MSNWNCTDVVADKFDCLLGLNHYELIAFAQTFAIAQIGELDRLAGLCRPGCKLLLRPCPVVVVLVGNDRTIDPYTKTGFVGYFDLFHGLELSCST